jgi:hypothetical protein
LTTKEKTFRQSRGWEGGRWIGKRKRKEERCRKRKSKRVSERGKRRRGKKKEKEGEEERG